MKRDAPHILLVNPWIHDFAAYDFWAKPMGLLTIAALLRQHGLRVSYLDCLNRFHPRAPQVNPSARHGRGPFLKTRIVKPAGLEDVDRNYSRYGILPSWFEEDLKSLERPDLVLVTSLMTYWYPGIQETIAMIKSIFPDTPIVLGGIYARLCEAHAKINSGADEVFASPAEPNILSLIQRYTGYSVALNFDPANLDSYPYPALDLQTRINYAPLLTSRGCPFNCAYCASHLLDPRRMLRSAESVVEEIHFWHRDYGIMDFVLYDDAFLVGAHNHAIPMLERIIHANLPIRFHTPNAIHIREINSQTARLMHRAGFHTLRLGLETVEFEHRQEIDKKVSEEEFKSAVGFLKDAGFDKSNVGAYLLVGLPDQSWESITQSIQTVKQNGITPVLAYYTPIPGTELWQRSVASSRYDLEADPIFSNNAVMPCRMEPFSWERISRMKDMAADI
jgi:radical SAM superfamily enzyme YgiQ (UPF0313 family)